MGKKTLRQTEGLLLARIAWDPTENRIFPSLISSLAGSTLQVVAFFSPPGSNPDEACFFVPEAQIDLLLGFCRDLRRQTGAAIQTQVTGKTLLEGNGWPANLVQKVFLSGDPGRQLLYLGKDTFAACCDEWEWDAVQEAFAAPTQE